MAKNSKFAILNKFGIYMNFEEQIWCILPEEIYFKNFTPIWSHCNENEKQMAII